MSAEQQKVLCENTGWDFASISMSLGSFATFFDGLLKNQFSPIF
jgi:hypothetical protein